MMERLDLESKKFSTVNTDVKSGMSLYDYRVIIESVVGKVPMVMRKDEVIIQKDLTIKQKNDILSKL